MRINPRQLLYFLPMIMRLPPKIRILAILAAVGFFAFTFCGKGLSSLPTGGNSGGGGFSQPRSGNSELPHEDLSIGEALSGEEGGGSKKN